MKYPTLSSILIPSGYILFRPYCRHFAAPYFEGISSKPKTEIRTDPELYQKEQKQRAIERKIREAKRLELSPNPSTVDKAGKRLSELKQERTALVNSNNDMYIHWNRESPNFKEDSRIDRGTKVVKRP